MPDAILERADEIELVDLPPEELLERLAEGKVYLPEQAARAAQHFFQRGNLMALRELALRRAAERVDAEVLAYRKAHEIASTWPTAERILVCVGPSPASARLVRAASRMAGTLRAPWIAASVETASLGRPLSSADEERLESHLRLARSLGGEVVRLTGSRAGQAVLEYARKHNVTRIVIGKPTRSRLVSLLRRRLFDEVVRESGDIDLYVISGDEGPPPEVRKAREPPELDWIAYGWTVGLVALTTVGATIAHLLLALARPRDALPARHHGGGGALRARTIGPRLGALGPRLRFLLRAALLDVRGQRSAPHLDVPHDVPGRDC